MSVRSKFWLAAVAATWAVFIVSALVLRNSFGLSVFTDFVEAALLASGAASFVPLAIESKGRMRLFWSLIIFGLSLWLAYQLIWTYYEVILRREVPALFSGDIILFLNLVPSMAALALRPHMQQDEYSARLGRLDFALLLTWWLYLYVLVVIPWQYVVVNVTAYGRNLNTLYAVEKLVLLAGLAACWATSTGRWRKFYASLFAMSLCYSAGSVLANWALERNTYYSGSFYDIPLASAMAWLTWIGLRTRVEEPTRDAREISTVYGVWVARCSMIAVFSLPLFATWAMAEVKVPSHIQVFRLTLTLVAALGMGVMVFFRQHLLDRELRQLLSLSHDSVDSLKRLQAQVLQSEKLASIGQLVGGIAHELNNPITAMLGYSDLLSSTPLTAEQRSSAAKIGHYVRRTRSLVASLISFAKQAPAPKTLIDLNTLARTAIKLAQPQWESLQIEVRTQFDSQSPNVVGDSNQVLQVCLQLMGNCLHAIAEQGGKTLTVTTERSDNVAVLKIAAEAMPSPPPAAQPAVSPADPEDNLGLSACQGILQEHGGKVSRERRQDGMLLLRMELPAAHAAPVIAKDPTLPVLWESLPYV